MRPFSTDADEVFSVRTGISGVSAEGAGRTLKAEQSEWDFERTRTAAESMWRDQLLRMRADSGTPDYKKVFYTALCHMSLGPQLFDDVDGQHRTLIIPSEYLEMFIRKLW